MADPKKRPMEDDTQRDISSDSSDFDQDQIGQSE